MMNRRIVYDCLVGMLTLDVATNYLLLSKVLKTSIVCYEAEYHAWRHLTLEEEEREKEAEAELVLLC